MKTKITKEESKKLKENIDKLSIKEMLRKILFLQINDIDYATNQDIIDFLKTK